MAAPTHIMGRDGFVNKRTSDRYTELTRQLEQATQPIILEWLGKGVPWHELYLACTGKMHSDILGVATRLRMHRRAERRALREDRKIEEAKKKVEEALSPAPKKKVSRAVPITTDSTTIPASAVTATSAPATNTPAQDSKFSAVFY